MLWTLLGGCLLTPGEVDELRLDLEDADDDGVRSDAYPNGLDCDDTRSDVYPGAPELCDGVDNDCDGREDEGWYVDADGDGAIGRDDSGLCAPGRAAQELPGDDCDDADPDIFPGALPDCRGGVDLNCNGIDDADDPYDGDLDGYADCIDDCAPEDPDLPVLLYADSDGDGYGDPAEPLHQASCEAVPGFVDNAEDCDDSDPRLNPGTTWYRDQDGDGYGVTSDALVQCLQPDGYSLEKGDCDDGDTAFHPGAPETVCTDPNDYNCDGSTGYSDSDGDGFAACEECDDSDALVNPDATEVCDAVDNDCDGATDEDDAADASTWYADTDKDGYGDPNESTRSCTVPTGYTADSQDCDDDDKDEHPGADEVCDGDDDDCDGDVDEDDAIDVRTWYADTDGDGYGDAAVTDIDCDKPGGYVANSTDCDDTDGDEHPGADEVCDGDDDDCDGTTDEDDAVDALTWYLDGDGDGHGDSAGGTTQACAEPSGYSSSDDDCDDGDPAVSPSATEICNNLTDDDCDPGTASACWLTGASGPGQAGGSVMGAGSPPSQGDLDGDGVGDIATPRYVVHGPVTAPIDAPTSGVDLSTVSDGSLADVADITGDGVADLLVFQSGQLNVLQGPTTTLTIGWNAAPADELDHHVHAGDMDGDGFQDFVYKTSGNAYAVFGGPSLSSLSSSTVGELPKVRCAVDIDGDGLDDPTDARGVFFSPLTSSTTTPDISLSLTSCDDAGDVDGDGYDDLLAGDIDYSYGGWTPGAAYLLFGDANLSSSPSWDVRISGYSAGFDGDEIGASVSSAGDTNADGHPDLLVGSPGDTKGAAYLFYGPLTSNTAVGNADFKVTGSSNGDTLGAFVLGGEDLSGDGVDDLVIGDEAGDYYVFFGGSY